MKCRPLETCPRWSPPSRGHGIITTDAELRPPMELVSRAPSGSRPQRDRTPPCEAVPDLAKRGFAPSYAAVLRGRFASSPSLQRPPDRCAGSRRQPRMPEIPQTARIAPLGLRPGFGHITVIEGG